MPRQVGPPQVAGWLIDLFVPIDFQLALRSNEQENNERKPTHMTSFVQRLSFRHRNSMNLRLAPKTLFVAPAFRDQRILLVDR